MRPLAENKRQNLLTAIRASALVILLAVFLGTGPSKLSASAQSKDDASEYKKLQELDQQTLHHGGNAATWRELRAIRDYFVKSGDPGALFLVEKLKAMNEAERKYLRGSEQLDIRVTQYMMLMEKQGTPLNIKYSIGFILADMFPHTSVETQTTILKTIVTSYTPSTYGREDRQFLDFALDRIGRPAVPYLIQVAGHNFPTVRCGAMGSLSDLAEDAKKAGLPDAPKLDCEATPKQREATLSEWKAWWEKYSDKFPYPELPSFFDLNAGEGIH
jgi:hypothetical protein